MSRYNPKDIETKWQQQWATDKLYTAKDFDERQKYVMLTEFPYPSGDGLHLGHVREYTLGDIMARHKRMLGYNVLYPMAYDAFGLPTENYAIKNKIAPQVATERNVATFQKQFESLGYGFDWDRSFKTTDPAYYKWTQWLFLRFFEKGLAYQDEIAINWCPKCKTGLANEEVVNGVHERCDTPVEKKFLKQWLLRITDYADRLIEGLRDVDYPSRIADQQINWIGRSTGAEVDFQLADGSAKITVFTTRPDTLFGATFMVLAPEHELVQRITTDQQRQAVEQYVAEAGRKEEIERMDDSREKTGVFTGAYAVNPANGQEIPIWIADYVLAGYGTGAIMAVPAHDQRDGDFASKYNLPIVNVINPSIIRDDVKHETRFNKQTKVVALVTDEQDRVLTIKWAPRHGGRMLVGGTMNDGESPRQTAEREVTEETGYTDLELVAAGDETIFYKYLAIVKQEINEAEVKVFHFRLRSDARQDQQLDDYEKDRFEVEWVSQAQAETDIREPLHRLVYDKFIHGARYTAEGIMTNSGQYDGLPSAEARDKIVTDLVQQGVARERVNYRLRDWIFSRQHYWGEPIPIIHCQKCGAVPVPEADLPVELPPVEHYEPTDTGESPLATIEGWVNVKCPQCGGPARRETDTMPNWAGSSWYYLRYFDAHNDQAFADRRKLDYWGAVDMYLGGMEHTTLHLLYSRFWHQFLYDQGLVPTPEPYLARRGQGIILAADGSKMSKSKGNVVNPTEIIEAGYGADALRLAIAFLAPYDQTTPWNSEGVAGTYRFLNRVWTLMQDHLAAEDHDDTSQADELRRATHAAIKRVSQDLDDMGFNTAVAALMEYVNELYKLKTMMPLGNGVWTEALAALLKLTAPYAPHLSEELWSQLGHQSSIHVEDWPKWQDAVLASSTATIVVQVNGKVRANLIVDAGASQEQIEAAAKADDKVRAYLADHETVKVIHVPGKLVNFVVRPLG